MKSILFLTPILLIFSACSLLVEFEDQKTPTERVCDDGRDNDDDGFIDCQDQDCEHDEACAGPNVNNFNNFNNINNFNNVSNPEICDNGSDDDRDGLTDCEDEEDCYLDPFCTTAEDCFDGEDNDHDGLTDCADDECWYLEECEVAGEHDCGDGVDNENPDGTEPAEGDGRIDCMDPECESNPICAESLIRCNNITEYDTNNFAVNYYTDIYQTGLSGDCPQSHYCTVRPEFSRVPHCYPVPGGTVVPAYGRCGADSPAPCGPGLVCARSDTLSLELDSEVCLPLCAPGHVDSCIGNTGVCYRRWEDAHDGWWDLPVELWMCDRPECDPLSADSLLNCQSIGAGCYPATDLMGGAFCHFLAGVGLAGTPCAGDDLVCLPGLVCRTGPLDGGVSRCHELCRTDAQCGQSSACLMQDNRQYFGFCK